MTADEGNIWGMGIVMFGYPAIIVITLVLFVVAAKMSGRRGSWAGPPRMLLLGWLGLLTFDIPLKLASLAIHCAFWTGFHVEPGKVVQPRHAPWCGEACVDGVIGNPDDRYVMTVTYPSTIWKEGETWSHAYTLTDEDDPECRGLWERAAGALAESSRDHGSIEAPCLRNVEVPGTEGPALYELRDEFDQTNPESIFWFTFKRGFEVWDIQADQMVAWFRGYEIRLWWLYPLELGCPADRAFMTDRVVVIDQIPS